MQGGAGGRGAALDARGSILCVLKRALHLAGCACVRGRRQSSAGGRAAKFQRGQAVATRPIPDKKLKARMRYSERLASEAAHAAAKTDEWLLPSEPGALEVEGMERTWQIQQARLPAPPPVSGHSLVIDIQLNEWKCAARAFY